MLLDRSHPSPGARYGWTSACCERRNTHKAVFKTALAGVGDDPFFIAIMQRLQLVQLWLLYLLVDECPSERPTDLSDAISDGSGTASFGRYLLSKVSSFQGCVLPSPDKMAVPSFYWTVSHDCADLCSYSSMTLVEQLADCYARVPVMAGRPVFSS